MARLRSAFLALVATALGVSAQGAGPPAPPIVELRVAGEYAVAFRHATDACATDDVPDAPARAFRGQDGAVTLFATHWRNRRLRGPDLLAVRPDCAVVLEGSDDPKPEQFNDRLWIAGTWTADGATVHALVHSEYHGHRRPDRCPTKRYMDCWYNVVSQAVSRDGGRSFHFERLPPPLVAAVPYRYDSNAGRHIGFFNPTNILRHNGAWFAMVWTEGAGLQKRGSCLLRTVDISDPAAWRAWDGRGFGTSFADPYAAELRPEEHLCKPVARGILHSPVTSLSRHAPSGAFIALMVGDRRDPAEGGALRRFIYASASWDLLRWSPPTVVREVAIASPSGCPEEAPLVYPSLLDPDSTDRNFETVGASAMLFMTRFNLRGCRHSMDRDLLRVPVKVSVRVN